MSVNPALDCPPCPECKQALGTPIVMAEVARWDGPDNATLWCPVCGVGWVGTPEDLKQAEASWMAYVEGEIDRARGES